ncbi:hypothetical protein TNIN_45401 [Trichonephila inaurata madagascariensis]|uniref:Uncharacterized protein n=1 Tax=Trichonephila inaurata madagascariensis TaxID=2747483 RepID=A0A8X7C1V6_9ARAC|nr:hypothetical protein TNIN_45401 [Trichonephila inaurata madagascariensis]
MTLSTLVDKQAFFGRVDEWCRHSMLMIWWLNQSDGIKFYQRQRFLKGIGSPFRGVARKQTCARDESPAPLSNV